ncbi:hypothetical protein U1Q18_032791, partial [Sarracenia purpurea var. burkii]
MRKCRASAITTRGRDRRHHRGKSSASSGPEVVMPGHGDVGGERGEGSRVPDAEEVSVVNEIIYESSIFHEDDTDLGFIEWGLMAADHDRLVKLPPDEITSGVFRSSAR